MPSVMCWRLELKTKFIIAGCLLITSCALGQDYGWVENMYLMPYHDRFMAKLDTGATTSSLLAEKIHYQKTAEGLVVDFEIPKTQYAPKREWHKKIIRFIKIKGRTEENAISVRRVVVLFRVCIGGRELNTEFNLTNRRRFKYPILLGRNTLQQLNAQILVNKMFMQNAKCY